MWAWGMSTKGVTSRFRWRRTSISWPWRGTWNATRAGQLGSARKSGAGRVLGGVVVELRRTRRSWPRGRWRFRKTGWSESIAPTTRASWRRYAAASSAGGRMARRNGRNGLPSVSAWNRRTARRVGRASRGGTRRPATRNGPSLLTSIANIGPVPFFVPSPAAGTVTRHRH